MSVRKIDVFGNVKKMVGQHWVSEAVVLRFEARLVCVDVFNYWYFHNSVS